MSAFDLYTGATPSYSQGAKDTGNGIGLPRVSPLLTDWSSSATVPPSGIGNDTACGWYGMLIYNDYLFALVRSTQGTGRGVNGYVVNTSNDPVTLTYDQMVDPTTLGMPQLFNPWHFQYVDNETGDILINSYDTAAQTYTIGRWNAAQWPWSAANAVWRACPSSWGSVVADKVANYSIPFVDKANDRVYCMSGSSGKCLTFKWSDGSYLGEFQWQASYSPLYVGNVVGVHPSSSYDVLLGHYLGASGGRIHRWDATNPASWTQGALVFDKATTIDSSGGAVPYGGKMPNGLRGNYARVWGIDRQQLDLIGVPSTAIGWVVWEPTYFGVDYGKQYLAFYDFDTDEYWESQIAKSCSFKRTGWSSRSACLFKVVEIDGNAWMAFSTQMSIDHFAEQPYMPNASGVAAVQIAPGRVEFDWTPTEDTNLKRLVFDVASAAVDSEFSTHPGKFRAALSVNGGAYTDWRGGPQELLNLDSVVHSKAAWPTLSAGVPVTLRLDVQSGIVDNFAPVQGNQGDRTTPNLPIADAGPPFDVRPVLIDEPVELGGGLL